MDSKQRDNAWPWLRAARAALHDMNVEVEVENETAEFLALYRMGADPHEAAMVLIDRWIVREGEER